MQNTISFTSKFFKTKLKYGITTQEILEYFALSEDEFYEKLYQTFSSEAVEDFLRQLKKNDKQRQHAIKKFSKSRSKNQPVVTSVVFPNSDLADYDMHNQDNIKCLDKAVLHNMLQNLLKEKDALEQQHNELKVQNMAERERLKNVSEEAFNIKAKLQELTTLADSYIKIISKNCEYMSKLTQEISKKGEKIKDVQSQIDELEKIVIFVYNDGSIEFENSNYNLPDEEIWRQVYDTIVSGNHPMAELFESLTMAQVKQIAKLNCFTKSVSNKCELTFENSDVQMIWNKLEKEV